MRVGVYGATTLAEGIALRRVLHALGLARRGFVRFAGDAHIRIGADERGRVFYATKSEQLGWGPWDRANTHSFDRFVRRAMGVEHAERRSEI